MSRFGTKEAQLTNALVPLGSAHDKPADVRATSRPHADFIAHLIATSELAPQTCARRRVAPREANAIYRLRDQVPTMTGRTLSRSL
jgi:hypothetical protein